MTKNELITEIRTAFKNFKLEDGIGLWEGQGIDDYADSETILKLRKKDERNNWDNIPYEDLVYCQSSLSFFDAKGMRFCLPKFLIFDILADEIFKEKGLSTDVLFTLSYELNEEYQKNRFSLLDNKQIEVVIHFLEYKLTEIVEKHREYSTNYDSTIDNTIFSDNEYIELNRTINEWRLKLN